MAFLGIRITTEVGRLLTGIEVPGENESASEYHITLLCFEDEWPIAEMARSLEVTYDIVSKFKPFSAKIDSVDCFPKHGEKAAIIAPVKSEKLHELRDKLAEAFEKEDIDFSKRFKDFKPHITLSYNDEEIEKFDIDDVDFIIHELVLWGGDKGEDRIFVTFPLKAPEKHSFLINKVDLFYKLATQEPYSVLSKSHERRKFSR